MNERRQEHQIKLCERKVREWTDDSVRLDWKLFVVQNYSLLLGNRFVWYSWRKLIVTLSSLFSFVMMLNDQPDAPSYVQHTLLTIFLIVFVFVKYSNSISETRDKKIRYVMQFLHHSSIESEAFSSVALERCEHFLFMQNIYRMFFFPDVLV